MTDTSALAPADHPVADRATWLAARRELLAVEKAASQHLDALAEQRRALPWVDITDDATSTYTFATEAGPQTLLDLFGPHPQLVVQHFMFGEDWEEGCPSCSFWADGLDGMTVHLAHRDTAFAAVSTAPLDTLLAYRQRMGWSFPWASAGGTSFNRDYGVTGSDTYNFTPTDEPIGELPGFSTFVRRGERVFHTNSVYARGLDIINNAYQLLDLTPLGRHEDDLEWSMAWLRRHDQY